MIKLKTTVRVNKDRSAKWWQEKYSCEIIVNERTVVYEQARTKKKLIKKVEKETLFNLR